MRPLTLEEVNRIGEAVSGELPVTSVLEWEYKVGKKFHVLNFRIGNKKDLPKNEIDCLERDIKTVQSLLSK